MKKKIISCSVLILLCLITFTQGINASYHGFAGSAGYSYRKVGDANPKDNHGYLGGIRWQSSDHSGHKEWFVIKNSQGAIRSSEILINRPSSETTYVNVTTTYGYYYYLYASREHLGNPYTYVTGTWQP